MWLYALKWALESDEVRKQDIYRSVWRSSVEGFSNSCDREYKQYFLCRKCWQTIIQFRSCFTFKLYVADDFIWSQCEHDVHLFRVCERCFRSALKPDIRLLYSY